MYDPAKLAPGMILLMTSSPHGSLPARVLDWLISASEGSPCVHACMVGDGHLIDPVWHVQRAPLDRYAENGFAFRVQATDGQRRMAVAWAEARVGQRYGLAELLAEGARLDLHIMPRAWYRWRPQRVVCSAFAARAYLAAGVRLTWDPLPTPASLSYSPLLIGRRPWKSKPPTGGIRA